MKSLQPARNIVGASALVVTLVLVAACSKAPDTTAPSPVVLLPATPGASVPDVAATAVPSTDAAASGGIVLGAVPDPAASAPVPASSAPVLSVGIPPPNPSASLPAAGSIGPAPTAVDAQPASVSPGPKQ